MCGIVGSGRSVRSVSVEFTESEARELLPLLARIQAFRRKLVNEVALLDKADEEKLSKDRGAYNALYPF